MEKSIYIKINEFLKEPKTASELVEFSNRLIKENPSETQTVREWFIEMIVKERFSGGLFGGATLQHVKAFWIKQ